MWTEASDGKEWDEFVLQNNGTIFHEWSWRGVLESTGSKPLYLTYYDRERTPLAVCPFFYRKGGRRLRYLLSLPISPVAGPIIGKGEGSAPKILSLLPKSVRFSISNPVVSMQIRVHQQPMIQALTNGGYRFEITDGLFVLDLQERTPDQIWRDFFQKHDRQAVKYYEQGNSWFGFARDERDYADYSALHEESLARGEERPIVPQEFLERMRSRLGERLKVTLVRMENKVVAGFSMICDPRNRTVYLLIIGYSRAKNIHSPVIYINWKTINWAFESGYRYINFGPTSPKTTDPVHKLKQRMGAIFVPRYRFTLPTAGIPYSLARGVRRGLRNLSGLKS